MTSKVIIKKNLKKISELIFSEVFKILEHTPLIPQQRFIFVLKHPNH